MVWDLQTRECIKSWRFEHEVEAARSRLTAIELEGYDITIATSCTEAVRIWVISNILDRSSQPECLWTLKEDQRVTHLQWSSECQSLFTTTQRNISRWNIRTGQRICSYSTRHNISAFLVFNGNIYAGCVQGTIELIPLEKTLVMLCCEAITRSITTLKTAKALKQMLPHDLWSNVFHAARLVFKKATSEPVDEPEFQY
eukprot:TRINITY_DN11305_c0_g1_i1.p1 TRINITY_DN11305_c0_g1~~TRINITY_DN11305_c0_g1_i1.p1  ORF type:complete len:199 (+),score=32.38 TRINITY_DN11305_c0_g1_i1:125-721(+)